MSAGPFRRGRRLFSTAAALLILVAAAHTAGIARLLFPTEPLPRVFGAMAAERTPMGMGMEPSVLDISLAVSLTMSVTLAALGLLNLVVAAAADTGAATLRRLAWLDAAWVGALVALYAHYRIPPPLVSTALVEVVLLANLVTTARDTPA